MVHTLRFFPSKCSLFHNSNVFGSCIIHILYTVCAKIKKIIPAPNGSPFYCQFNAVSSNTCTFVQSLLLADDSQFTTELRQHIRTLTQGLRLRTASDLWCQQHQHHFRQIVITECRNVSRAASGVGGSGSACPRVAQCYKAVIQTAGQSGIMLYCGHTDCRSERYSVVWRSYRLSVRVTQCCTAVIQTVGQGGTVLYGGHRDCWSDSRKFRSRTHKQHVDFTSKIFCFVERLHNSKQLQFPHSVCDTRHKQHVIRSSVFTVRYEYCKYHAWPRTSVTGLSPQRIFNAMPVHVRCVVDQLALYGVSCHSPGVTDWPAP